MPQFINMAFTLCLSISEIFILPYLKPYNEWNGLTLWYAVWLYRLKVGWAYPHSDNHNQNVIVAHSQKHT